MKLVLALAASLLCSMWQDPKPQDPPKDTGKEIDNPEYAGWKDIKVGSWVKIKMENEMTARGGEMTMTKKLLEVTPEKVVIEQSTTMKMMGKEHSMPGSKVEVKAKIKESEMNRGGGEDGGGKFTKTGEGDEELEVGGKKVKCHFVEGAWESAKGGKGTSKVWYSKEVIGSFAKAVFTTESPKKSSMTMTVLESKSE